MTRSCEQRDDRRERHLPGAEVGRHQEGRPGPGTRPGRSDRLLGDVRAPGRADERRGDLVLRDSVGRGQGIGDLRVWSRAELVGLHAHGVRRRCWSRSGWCSGATPTHGLFHRRRCPRGPTSETVNSEPPRNSMPRLKPPLTTGTRIESEHQDAGDREPELALADEVEGPLAGVEVVAECCEISHQ